MAEISAALVMKLRNKTGAGMMVCKNALTEANGDFDEAEKIIAISGERKAAKAATKTAAEGIVCILGDEKKAAILEVNCQTDFVARDESFKKFAEDSCSLILSSNTTDMELLKTKPLTSASDVTVEAARQELIIRIGENVQLRRALVVEAHEGQLAHYIHGGRIGVIVHLIGGTAELAKGLAMHIAACSPICIEAKDIPAEMVAREREIAQAQAAESGKPANIIEKMIDGRIAKYTNEICLLGQSYVREPENSIEKVLKAANAKVAGFVRYAVGEGIEKEEVDFAAEVAAQVRGGA